jgi:DNA-binding CsgD family transcriptional regulator
MAGTRVRSRTSVVPAGAPGFLLLTPQLEPLYSNQTALEILGYPDGPVRDLSSLRTRIRSILGHDGTASYGQTIEFMSGRRHYAGRVFQLESEYEGIFPRVTALVFERRPSSPTDVSEVSRLYRLSPRESETVKYLLLGLTTKEVAQSMRVSPNTIKQFLRIAMTKMGVSTRSGIVAKVWGGRAQAS